MSTIKPRIRPTPWHLATPLMPIEPVPGMEWECRVIGRIAIGYGASPREAYERWATLRAASMARQDILASEHLYDCHGPALMERLRAWWARIQREVPFS